MNDIERARNEVAMNRNSLNGLQDFFRSSARAEEALFARCWIEAC